MYEAIVGLLGIIIGFVLGLSRDYFKEKKRIKTIKSALEKELKSIKQQIPQKIEIINQICDNLDKGNFLSGISVKFIMNIYKNYIAEITVNISDKERNCLHVIYEKLINADNILHTIDDKLRDDFNNKMFSNPFKVHKIILQDIKQNLEMVRDSIDTFLAKNPTDVFYIESMKPQR